MMGVDLAGTVLANSAGLVALGGGSTQIMKMGTTGILQRYNLGQPMFRAGSNAAAVAFVADSWNAIVFNLAPYNIGSCYSTSNGRFTAPVDGVYLFTADTYVTGGIAGWYIHSMFYVNGSTNARRPCAGSLYRIHAHGHTVGYTTDTETFEIISLLAGDYVQLYNYSPGTNTNNPSAMRFEGYLLG